MVRPQRARVKVPWLALRPVLENPTTSPMFAGHAVHNATFDILGNSHPGRFTYNPSRGIDITDSLTRQKVEIATQAQAAWKATKYPNASGIASYR